MFHPVTHPHLRSRTKALLLALIDAVCMTGLSLALLMWAAHLGMVNNGLPVEIDHLRLYMTVAMVAVFAFVCSYVGVWTIQARPDLRTTVARRILTGLAGALVLTALAWFVMWARRDRPLTPSEMLRGAAIFGTFMTPIFYRLFAYHRIVQFRARTVDDPPTGELEADEAEVPATAVGPQVEETPPPAPSQS